MKKGKVIGKGQIAVGVMVVALVAAIWLNTKYMPTTTKYLGEASYVSNTSENAVQTSAKVENDFSKAQNERKKALETACETVEELLKSENLTEKDKESALKQIENIGNTIKKEANIEMLLKAKGFSQAVAVIGNDGINVIVKSDGLTTANTMQIQDIVTTESGLDLSKIKIIPIK
ncbi:MAG: SpoIIIAH-like family protein [Clostridia bacterium]|nr:SpoIIIAH-like family protein [Clostridia bacterium]MBR3909538.1 SpoIIIAH-like family protein [Clostridia bacterium]MBR6564080.1 SpoIIIAH-like family protein [Clostridia bacterium]